jgi:hypothetical protein
MASTPVSHPTWDRITEHFLSWWNTTTLDVPRMMKEWTEDKFHLRLDGKVVEDKEEIMQTLSRIHRATQSILPLFRRVNPGPDGECLWGHSSVRMYVKGHTTLVIDIARTYNAQTGASEIGTLFDVQGYCL